MARTIRMENLTPKQVNDRTVFCSCYGRVMNKAKAARVLGVSRSTIYNMIEDGRLRCAANGMVDSWSAWAHIMGVAMS